MKSGFALVDCNNFYVSCERVFAPHLQGEPVIVLSNNDACVVARSEEVKALGIPRGAPLFPWRQQVQEHHIHLYSSNYPLYGDMSRRVAQTLAQFAPQVEVYSIDEVFLALDGSPGETTPYCHELRQQVEQWTGLPVTIGVDCTKTLAKLATRIAKQDPQYAGVLDLGREPGREELLAHLDVEEVWGIGPRSAAKLRAHGIHTVAQLQQAPDRWIRKHLTITGLRTVYELRGLSCLSLEEVRPPRKSLVCARSFGRLVASREELRQAVTAYVARLAEKLRAQGAVAARLQVFLRTPRYRTDLPQRAVGGEVPLAVPTAYTPDLIRQAVQLLDELYLPGYHYQQVGVRLDGLAPQEQTVLNLFDRAEPDPRRDRLMQAVDQINARWGPGTLRFAAQAGPSDWAMQQARLSPRYTTCWEELWVVHATSPTPPNLRRIPSQPPPEAADPPPENGAGGPGTARGKSGSSSVPSRLSDPGTPDDPLIPCVFCQQWPCRCPARFPAKRPRREFPQPSDEAQEPHHHGWKQTDEQGEPIRDRQGPVGQQLQALEADEAPEHR